MYRAEFVNGSSYCAATYEPVLSAPGLTYRKRSPSVTRAAVRLSPRRNREENSSPRTPRPATTSAILYSLRLRSDTAAACTNDSDRPLGKADCLPHQDCLVRSCKESVRDRGSRCTA